MLLVRPARGPFGYKLVNWRPEISLRIQRGNVGDQAANYKYTIMRKTSCGAESPPIIAEFNRLRQDLQRYAPKPE
jgi:hypothetical protein